MHVLEQSCHDLFEESVNVRRWLFPSLGTAMCLALFLGLCWSNWRFVLISADGDPCLHWRIGNWMIEHRQIIRNDQFSHTAFGEPLVSKEWLGELAFAAAANLLGWNGAVLLSALLITTTLWLLHRWLLSEGCDPLLATGLVLLAALASSHHWLARPHLMTHLLTVVFAWQLQAFDRDRCSAKRLFVLVPLMTLWTNLHGAFFTGFVLIGIYAFGNLRQPKKAKFLVALGFASLAASFVNPNGWRLHAHILQFLREPTVARFANEFRSPNFHSGGMRGFLLQLLVLGLLLLVARPRWRATDVLLVGVWGCLALDSVRNVPIFAIVVTPILGEHWQFYLRHIPDNVFVRFVRRLSKTVAALNQAAGGEALAVAAFAIVLYAQATQAIKTDLLATRFPVKATEWLRANRDAVRNEMFNDYGWGGYLLLALPERRVFIDGRNDFYGARLVKEFNKVDEIEPGWETVLKKYDVGWTILPRAHALNSLLALRSDWHLVYTDEVTTVYGQVVAPR
jgi:hypothetical protein